LGDAREALVMDGPSSTDISLFEGFRLDRRGGALFRRDERGVFAPMTIGSRALGILGVLVERPGELVSRDEIMEAVWPGTVVEDSNLNVQVAALRRILDEDREQGSCIQTVSGRGYRLVVPVTPVEPATPQSGNSSGGPVAEAPAHLTVAPRLSIVVLPFTNLSDDREQQYFADGITEESQLGAGIRPHRRVQALHRVGRGGNRAPEAIHPPQPLRSQNAFRYSRIGHLLQSRTDEAIAWFEKARSANPGTPVVRAFLASA
jgi:DNA-binding winged helix-turn-helix (wHTH) protein